MASLECRLPHLAPDSAWGISPDASPDVTQEGRKALELLRVLGLTWLILYHTALIGSQNRTDLLSKMLGLIGNAGYMGTDLFLALAGFLAVGSFSRSKGSLSWLLRRFVRVFPALALFLVAYLHIIPFLINALGGSPESLPNYGNLDRARNQEWMMWTMVSNYLMFSSQRMGAALEPHLTLGLFAQLTVLAAFLLPSRSRIYWGLGLVALVGVGLRLYWLHADRYMPYSFPLSRGEGFLLGLAFASLLRSGAYRERLLALRGRFLLVSSIAMLGLMVGIRGEWVGSPWMRLLGYPTVAFWSASVVLWLANLSAFPGILSPIAKLGRSTYCAYFVKLPLCFLIACFLPQTKHLPFPVVVLACIAATWAVAVFWHVTLERPLVRWGRRLVGGQSHLDGLAADPRKGPCPSVEGP